MTKRNIIIGIIVLLYAIFPDAFPGPLDDALVALAGWLLSERKKVEA